MLFRIQGRDYSASALQDISLTDMLAVRQKTGLSMAELDAAIMKMTEDAGRAGADATSPGLEVLDEAALLGLAVMIWLARRKGGDRDITLEEAADFPLHQLEIVAEPGDEPEAPAPNRPARRARATKKAPSTAGRTRTSKARSGPA